MGRCFSRVKEWLGRDLEPARFAAGAADPDDFASYGLAGSEGLHRGQVFGGERAAVLVHGPPAAVEGLEAHHLVAGQPQDLLCAGIARLYGAPGVHEQDAFLEVVEDGPVRHLGAVRPALAFFGSRHGRLSCFSLASKVA